LFAVAAPVILGMVGLGIDYSLMTRERSKMQVAADAAALAAAGELHLAQSSMNNVPALAQTYAQANLASSAPELGAQVKATVIDNGKAVRVVITASHQSMLARVISQGSVTLGVQAIARISGGYPICGIGLDPMAPGTIHLESEARVFAPKCAVYSNSSSREGIKAVQSAVLTAAVICSAGGKVGSRANFTPMPQTDCPVMPDPLASRPSPVVGGCNTTDKVVDGLTVTLSPGTYCNGLKVTGGANVKLNPGLYVIKDGPLVVDRNSTLQGTNVGFYLAGDRTTLTFGSDTTINLTAPKDGPLSGILLFEDRAAPHLRQHKILSNDARILLGTIYLSRGRLVVDAKKPIADKSAYTIVVVRRLEVFSGPTLVLNSDYSASDVPTPKGVGPGAKSVLVK
jgi:Flp pilus assembly protein TadG